MDLFQVDEPGDAGAIDDEVAGMCVSASAIVSGCGRCQRLHPSAHELEFFDDLAARAKVRDGLVGESALSALLHDIERRMKRISPGADQGACRRNGSE